MNLSKPRTRRWVVAGVALAPFVGRVSPSRATVVGAKTLAFENLHTRETLRSTFWRDGCIVGESARAIDSILRDHRTGEVHPIEADLLLALFEIRRRLETDAPFQVISGYRSPRTNLKLASTGRGVASKSLHLQGKAIDVRVPGVPLDVLHRAAVGIRAGGVGLYRASDFVHIDVGPIRYW